MISLLICAYINYARMHCPMTAKQPIIPPRVDEPVFNIEHICEMLSVCEILYVCGSHALMAESHLVFHITFLGPVSGALCNFFSDMVIETLSALHDDVIKWKHFPRYWPFVRGIHRSPVNSPHKGQWRGALMFTLICARINSWVNNCEAGDLRGNRAHYDVIVMLALCDGGHYAHVTAL